MSKVISIDPGQKKCGLLLADIESKVVLDGRIVKREYVIELINDWMENYNIDLFILGNGTGSKYWKLLLIDNNIISIRLVEEARTTLRARDRYWQLFPPKSICSKLLKTLSLTPKNIDSVVSLILIEDYFGIQITWKCPPNFKIWP
ncbi:resolvase [Prochlorococcus marinus]|uniref:resolvase n=1 Tax=Prochlorococcus marinus TaxID=1219 RepID=UPI0022B33A20|nr:resolvase [Prochlorococcus marinus]